ncbi:MAG: ATP-binding protein [Bacteroidota bacterium]
MGTTENIASLNFQLAFGIIGMILLTAFIVVFFIVYQRRLLQQQIATQQIEASYQKELLNAGIMAQEAERKRMAIELHDGIGGLLSTIKIYISNLNQELGEEQFLLFKEKSLTALNENILEVRTITHNLLPQSLERLGIVSATRDLTVKLVQLNGMAVNFHANKEIRFDPDREKALFRILQELINNTLKYSEAKNVLLDFQFGDRQLVIHYKEDGIGFDKNTYLQQKDQKSFGLLNMESRIAFLKGEMQYETAPGNGVEVNLSLPL